MVDRATVLAQEEGIAVTTAAVAEVVRNDDTRRAAAYSAYGYWLIRRLDGHTDGPAVLALWREIAWNRAGSPIRGFRLRYGDVADAEESLADALRSSPEDGTAGCEEVR
jgi:hypothetical protein